MKENAASASNPEPHTQPGTLKGERMPFSGLIDFIRMAGSGWFLFSGGMLLLATVVVIVGWALLEEAALARSRKISRRHSFADSRQSDAVCLCTRRLGSVRRANRLDAVRILRDLKDPSAAPALLKALDRYSRDVPFVIEVIETLVCLGDPRAVPALRALTVGRHYDLMRVARRAVETLEAQAILLRPCEQPRHVTAQSSRLLLRAAHPHSCPEPGILLRAGERPGP
jgi:hypothetical protein